MDIHPPEHPIRSLRDFAVQLFTVTCGILIALGLEALVERHHDQALADHARQNFRTEIAANRSKLATVIAMSGSEQSMLAGLIAYGTARLHHETPKLPHASTSRSFAAYSANAWQTALATEAVGQLGFAESDAIAAAYTKQAILNEISAQAREQWLGIAAYDNLDDLDEADVREALKQVRIAYIYTATLQNLESQLDSAYAAAEKSLRQKGG